MITMNLRDKSEFWIMVKTEYGVTKRGPYATRRTALKACKKIFGASLYSMGTAHIYEINWLSLASKIKKMEGGS